MKAICIALFISAAGCAFTQAAEASQSITFKETILHSFSGGGADGAYPAAGLIDVRGTLYGTTTSGSGDGYRGTVFALDPKTGAETVVYSFCSKRSCWDGFNPSGGLILAKGMLYGTANSGGSGFDGQQFGTAFRLDPNTGVEKVLYSFCQQQNCPDGAYPEGGLTNIGGTMYGTTQSGGGEFAGTVFVLDRKTGAETVIHSFCSQEKCTDGAEPAAPMINVNGMLYGTTLVGGYPPCTGNDPPGCGTVFALDPATGLETVLHAFTGGTDGRLPEAGLLAVNGVLYGTTFGGGVAGCIGDFGCGTVFSIDMETGAESILYSFCGRANCADGAEPFSSVIQAGGILYGTTQAGGGTGCGGAGCGTVFSIDPATGVQTVLYAFQGGPDGANPEAGLLAMNGKFYGTTSTGGAYGYGTVFELRQKN